ncbi:energy transducer TonB [Flavobacterium sp. ENC]|uniref:energy transducer TonB n=1 Tax=Flavobacterium sp. ENC TaxID=2897330 RepID=UPI001E397AFC|nr:energy transducer TonB [Flavobacterium sp. ENC]MCD0467571.1 energy transducer TonB [Flavobacterium sp. ENC]
MKKFLFLILICFAQFTFSQTGKDRGKPAVAPTNTVANENLIYAINGIDTKPEFPGGSTEFTNFLEKNFIKPADKPTVKGKIHFTFIIEKDGSLSDIKILRDLGAKTGDEAIRILKLAPKWNPGKQNGKEVRTLNAGFITIR